MAETPNDNDALDRAVEAIKVSNALQHMRHAAQYGPAAAIIVQTCAFFAPASIPDVVFGQGIEEPSNLVLPFGGDATLFANTVADACNYGLLCRETDPPGLRMPPLAQQALRDSLSEDECKRRSDRAVRSVSAAFPQPNFSEWPLCERLLPHALLCAEYIYAYDFQMPEAVLLLVNTAWYLWERARYTEAEPLYLKALAICKGLQGTEHTDVASILNHLALLYRYMGRYEEAVPLLEEAVVIGRKTIGAEHLGYANRLNNLAGVYSCQQRYEEAETLYKQALDITRHVGGVEHSDVAACLNNLAQVYTNTERYEEAEPLLKQALAIGRKTIGEECPDYAACLLNLGTLYLNLGRMNEAEPLLLQALMVDENALGPQHPSVAFCHSWLGELRYRQGYHTDAVNHFRLALKIQERTLGPNNPDTVIAHKRLLSATSAEP